MHGYDATRFDPPAPLAIVTLRNQDGENTLDVPLLLDSGAAEFGSFAIITHLGFRSVQASRLFDPPRTHLSLPADP